ncbi:hypothetical protein C8Q78DRAFT_994650 [Trametes maxima]|nr:hypothetical protein C8Q78DRAFT_994650 [Trametes maxima]
MALTVPTVEDDSLRQHARELHISLTLSADSKIHLKLDIGDPALSAVAPAEGNSVHLTIGGDSRNGRRPLITQTKPSEQDPGPSTPAADGGSTHSCTGTPEASSYPPPKPTTPPSPRRRSLEPSAHPTSKTVLHTLSPSSASNSAPLPLSKNPPSPRSGSQSRSPSWDLDASGDDTGDDTESDVDPVNDAYCLGFYDGRRSGMHEFRQKVVAKLEIVMPDKVEEDEDSEDHAPVDPVEDGTQRPWTPLRSPSPLETSYSMAGIRAGCSLTPRSRKRINEVLPPSPDVWHAVKKVKKDHGMWHSS